MQAKHRYLLFGVIIASVWLIQPAVTGAAESEEQEEEIALSQVTGAVRATLERESQAGKIEEITRKTRDNKTWYEADVRLDGKKYELEIAADGTLIRKTLEIEEEGDSEKAGEEGDKEEAGEEGEDKKPETKAAKEEKPAKEKKSAGWMSRFDEDKADLASTGKNRFFSLMPGYVLLLKNEDGDELKITVLDETKTIDGVETRVIEERETADGELAEISLNWFAISKKSGNVYYFGEESKDYKDGKVVSEGGSWEAGKNGARFGMIMPGKPKVGQRYYQEYAPKSAMDRAENVSLSETVKVPAGEFKKCLKTQESSALEGGTESKYYAPNVGLLQDEDFELVSYGIENKRSEKPKRAK